jgi:hypothetical protein
MNKVLGALVAAAALVALIGCAAPIPPSPASPSPGQSPERAAPNESPASDACAELTAVDATAAIAALPGWWYDLLATSVAGTPQPGIRQVREYVAPDRLRDLYWDEIAVQHGQIFVGGRVWTYAGGSPGSSPVDPAGFARRLETVFPFKGTFSESEFPFAGDLPGDGLRESPRVADTECLATDPNTGTSLVTTRSGQLVRIRRATLWRGFDLPNDAHLPRQHAAADRATVVGGSAHGATHPSLGYAAADRPSLASRPSRWTSRRLSRVDGGSPASIPVVSV